MRRALLAAGLATGLAGAASAQPADRPGFGFDVRLVDRSVDPCVDFYQFACGQWLKQNPVPPEYALWGRFVELEQRNREELRGILEKAAAPAEGRDPLHQKIGDYYAACMDTALAEKEGLAPLKADLERISTIADARGVVAEVARLHREGDGAFLFRFGSTQDARDAREVIAEADQGGLSLPERDYYTRTDEKSQELLGKYRAHVARILALAGESEEEAKSDAAAVLAVETALAKGSLTNVERRDPEKLYHRTKTADLPKIAASLPWEAYFLGVGLGPVASINVASPGFFAALDEQLRTAPLSSWKAYLRWHVLHAAAPRLSQAFVDEDFDFFGRALTGTKALQPRWKRCVAATDRDLRDLLGKPYVDATFGADGKARMNAMVEALKGAMREDLKKVAWMDDPTRARALEKLGTFLTKIGYPDRWIDMSAVVVDRSGWQRNHERAAAFQVARDLAKVGKPFDRLEWRMTTPTVNASYSPERNDITFPAGILQPPFFDKSKDDAVNYGGIGAVIGHEISHGFDDEGRQYDKDGNLKDWWTARATAEFTKRAGCVEKQYSEYVAVDDLHVNGKLTMGENIGDLGGLKIAWAAFRETAQGKAKDAPAIEGFSPDQRFFLAWGQIWCRNATPEEKRRRVRVDPHSPAEARVNAPLSNMKAFADAFRCPEGKPMVRNAAQLCEVW